MIACDEFNHQVIAVQSTCSISSLTSMIFSYLWRSEKLGNLLANLATSMSFSVQKADEANDLRNVCCTCVVRKRETWVCVSAGGARHLLKSPSTHPWCSDRQAAAILSAQYSLDHPAAATASTQSNHTHSLVQCALQ